MELRANLDFRWRRKTKCSIVQFTEGGFLTACSWLTRIPSAETSGLNLRLYVEISEDELWAK